MRGFARKKAWLPDLEAKTLGGPVGRDKFGIVPVRGYQTCSMEPRRQSDQDVEMEVSQLFWREASFLPHFSQELA
jgi:hypothetical protein